MDFGTFENFWQISFFNTCNAWYVERVLRNTCN